MAKSIETKVKKSISRQVIFPAPLYRLLEIRLKQLGVSAPEYVRHLVVQDVKPLYQDIPMVDEETEASIGRALDDIKHHRTYSFNSSEEMQKFLDELAEGKVHV